MGDYYRLIGYYADTGQVYDSDWDGDSADDAVANCRAAIYPQERENLVLVAILLNGEENVYEGDTASHITDWNSDEDDDADA